MNKEIEKLIQEIEEEIKVLESDKYALPSTENTLEQAYKVIYGKDGNSGIKKLTKLFWQLMEKS